MNSSTGRVFTVLLGLTIGFSTLMAIVPVLSLNTYAQTNNETEASETAEMGNMTNMTAATGPGGDGRTAWIEGGRALSGISQGRQPAASRPRRVPAFEPLGRNFARVAGGDGGRHSCRGHQCRRQPGDHQRAGLWSSRATAISARSGARHPLSDPRLDAAGRAERRRTSARRGSLFIATHDRRV